MTHFPDKFLIAGGCSVALIAVSFLLMGAHREVRHRLRHWRRGGYLMGGDRSLMACATCDDYQLVEGTDGFLVDCPDCHRDAPRAWCPVHSVRLDEDDRCPRCVREAELATARILHARRARGCSKVAA